MWDAMQRCLRRHGELHNNLRMTWGKAFLTWAPSPALALQWALDLNHKYALDGGDPCSYAGVLWCFGGFDGPKAAQATPVTGSVRQRSTAKHRSKQHAYAALVDASAYCQPHLANPLQRFATYATAVTAQPEGPLAAPTPAPARVGVAQRTLQPTASPPQLSFASPPLAPPEKKAKVSRSRRHRGKRVQTAASPFLDQ